MTASEYRFTARHRDRLMRRLELPGERNERRETLLIVACVELLAAIYLGAFFLS
jgi:hypothetical protein